MPKNKRQSPTKHSQRKGNRSSGKDQIFQSVQEMFSGQIEAEVIHLVLEECDWQVEKALDNLCALCDGDIQTDRENKNRLAQIARDVLCGESSSDSMSVSSHSSMTSSEEIHDGLVKTSNHSSRENILNSTEIEGAVGFDPSLIEKEIENLDDQNMIMDQFYADAASWLSSVDSVGVNSKDLGKVESLPVRGSVSPHTEGVDQSAFPSTSKDLGTVESLLVGETISPHTEGVDQSPTAATSRKDLALGCDEVQIDSNYKMCASLAIDTDELPDSSLCIGDSLGETGSCTPSDVVLWGDKCLSNQSDIGDNGHAQSNRGIPGSDGDNRSTPPTADKRGLITEHNTCSMTGLSSSDIVFGQPKPLTLPTVTQQLWSCSSDTASHFPSSDGEIGDMAPKKLESIESVILDGMTDDSVRNENGDQDVLSGDCGRMVESETDQPLSVFENLGKLAGEISQLWREPLIIPPEHEGFDMFNNDDFEKEFLARFSRSDNMQLSDGSKEFNLKLGERYDDNGLIGNLTKIKNIEGQNYEGKTDFVVNENLTDLCNSSNRDKSDFPSEMGMDSSTDNQLITESLNVTDDSAAYGELDVNVSSSSSDSFTESLTRALNDSLDLTESLSLSHDNDVGRLSRMCGGMGSQSEDELGEEFTLALNRTVDLTSPEEVSITEPRQAVSNRDMTASSKEILHLHTSDSEEKLDEFYVGDKKIKNSVSLGGIESQTSLKPGNDVKLAPNVFGLSVNAPEFVPRFGEKAPTSCNVNNNGDVNGSQATPTFLAPRYVSPPKSKGGPSSPADKQENKPPFCPTTPVWGRADNGAPRALPHPPWVTPVGHGLAGTDHTDNCPVTYVPRAWPASPDLLQRPPQHWLPVAPLAAPGVKVTAPGFKDTPPGFKVAAKVMKGPAPGVKVTVPGVKVMAPDIEAAEETIQAGHKCMVMLRGLPGSGKSTLARRLQHLTKSVGVVLSTDDYFILNGVYKFELHLLSDAHEWNRLRTIQHLHNGRSPIVVDNTNTQMWEMKPYLKQAQKFGYQIHLVEPDTPWKFHAKELSRRNSHGVPLEKIRVMLDRYERGLTPERILGRSYIPKKLASEKKVNPTTSVKEETEGWTDVNKSRVGAGWRHSHSSLVHQYAHNLGQSDSRRQTVKQPRMSSPPTDLPAHQSNVLAPQPSDAFLSQPIPSTVDAQHESNVKAPESTSALSPSCDGKKDGSEIPEASWQTWERLGLSNLVKQISMTDSKEDNTVCEQASLGLPQDDQLSGRSDHQTEIAIVSDRMPIEISPDDQQSGRSDHSQGEAVGILSNRILLDLCADDQASAIQTDDNPVNISTSTVNKDHTGDSTKYSESLETISTASRSEESKDLGSPRSHKGYMDVNVKDGSPRSQSSYTRDASPSSDGTYHTCSEMWTDCEEVGSSQSADSLLNLSGLSLKSEEGSEVISVPNQPSLSLRSEEGSEVITVPGQSSLSLGSEERSLVITEPGQSSLSLRSEEGLKVIVVPSQSSLSLGSEEGSEVIAVPGQSSLSLRSEEGSKVIAVPDQSSLSLRSEEGLEVISVPGQSSLSLRSEEGSEVIAEPVQVSSSVDHAVENYTQQTSVSASDSQQTSFSQEVREETESKKQREESVNARCVGNSDSSCNTQSVEGATSCNPWPADMSNMFTHEKDVESITLESAESVTHESAESVTHESAESVTHESAESVTHESAESVTHESAESVTHESAPPDDVSQIVMDTVVDSSELVQNVVTMEDITSDNIPTGVNKTGDNIVAISVNENDVNDIIPASVKDMDIGNIVMNHVEDDNATGVEYVMDKILRCIEESADNIPFIEEANAISESVNDAEDNVHASVNNGMANIPANLEDVVDVIPTNVEELMGTIPASVNDSMEIISTNMAATIDVIPTNVEELMGNIPASVNDSMENISTNMAATIDVIPTNVEELMGTIPVSVNDSMEIISTNMAATIDVIPTNVEELMGNIPASVNDSMENISTNMAATIDIIPTNVEELMGNIPTSVNDSMENISTNMAATIDIIPTNVEELMDNIPASVNDSVEKISTHMAATIDIIPTNVKELMGNIPASVNDSMENISTHMAATIDIIPTNVEELMGNIPASVNDSMENISTHMAATIDIIPTNVEELMDNIPASVNDSVEKMSTNMAATIDNVPTNVEEFMENIPASVNDSMENISTNMAATIDAIPASVKDTVDDLIREQVGSELRSTMDISVMAEELKAFLIFTDLDEDHKNMAELYINYKLVDSDAKHNFVGTDTELELLNMDTELVDEADYFLEGSNTEVNIAQLSEPVSQGLVTPHTQTDGTVNLESEEPGPTPQISDKRARVNKITQCRQDVDMTEVCTELVMAVEEDNGDSWTRPQPRRDQRSRNVRKHTESPVVDPLKDLGSRSEAAIASIVSRDTSNTREDAISQSSGRESSLDSSPTKPARKKKSYRRKLDPYKQGPFIEPAVKEKVIGADWVFPEMTPPPQPKVEVQERTVRYVLDHGSSITVRDLKVLNAISRGEDVSHMLGDGPRYQILVCGYRNISRDEADTNLSSDTSSVTSATTQWCVDRGTMTEECLDTGIDFLQNSFPAIPVRELSDILQQCDNDLQWAINLLLDWKYNLPLTSDDKDKFVGRMVQLQKSPTIQKFCFSQRSASVARSPPSLLDLCVGHVESQHIAPREEVEHQIIRNSQQRLNSIEEQIRMKRTVSRTCSQSVPDDEEFKDAIIQELCKTEQESPDHVSEAGDDKGHDQNHSSVSYVESWTANQANDFARGPSVESSTSGHRSDDDLAMEDTPDFQTLQSSVPVMSLPVPREIIMSLMSQFGPVPHLSGGSGDVLVPIDHRTAQALHRCLMLTVQRHTDDRHRQLQQDEAFARQLQNEEIMTTTCRPPPMIAAPPVRRPQPFGRTSGHRATSSEVTSLKDIMVEEMEKERKEEEEDYDLDDEGSPSDSREQKLLEASGNHNVLANRLKRRKLYEQFPGVDETLLDDIYRDNSYHLDNTVLAIRGFLAHDSTPPRTARTSEATEAYEEKLIDAAKQQSLQEMMDSYLYSPEVTEDYQTHEDPDYEDFRGEANVHYRLRHECFQKAQEAYRRGMKDVASFYSRQGHIHTEKIKEANHRAADNIIHSRNNLLEERSTIDLHGLHVDEAINALETILPTREDEFQKRPDKRKQHLVIITGRGSHSRGGIARIRPAVIRFLRAKGYKYTEPYKGVFKVLLKYRSS